MAEKDKAVNSDLHMSVGDLIKKYGSAVDAVLAVNIEAMNIGRSMQLIATMAREIAEQTKKATPKSRP